MGRPKKVKEIKAKLHEDDKIETLKKIVNEKNRECGFPILKFAKDEVAPDRILFDVPEIDAMIGGLPTKRFSIVWGEKGSAKSSLAYYAIAKAQKMGKYCAYIDLENSFDCCRAEQFGVNLDTLLLGNGFKNAEQALDSFISLVDNKTVDFVVLDSVQALSPKGEQETKAGVVKSVEDDTMALLARKLSQFFRMSAGGVYRGNVAVLLIGQTRIGMKGIFALTQLSGGNALQHWSTLTIHATRGPKDEAPVEKIETEEVDDNGKKIKIKKAVGFQSILKLEKTKISGTKVEGSEVKLPFYFTSGFKQENKETIDEKEQE